MLNILIERAGFLDTNTEPDGAQEQYTTGAGVVNAAWLACLLEGRPLTEALLPASPSRSVAEPESIGDYGYLHTELNG